MNQQPDPMHERYFVRLHKRRILIVVGIITMAFGYGLLAISPDTSMDWVLVRVVLGFVFILFGFVVAVIPLLSRILGTND